MPSFREDTDYDYSNDSIEDDDSYDSIEDSVDLDLAEELLKMSNLRLKNGEKTNGGQKMMTADEVAQLLMNVSLRDNTNNEFDVNQTRDSKSVSVILSPSDATTVNSNNTRDDNRTHPQTILNQILKLNGYEQDSINLADVPQGFFLEMKDENVQAYTNEMLSAVRSQDTDMLAKYLSEGKNMQSCNQFGESIISLACRKGSTKVVEFLLNKADVSIQICDDYGRTPLHDACWVSEPDFNLIKMLVKICPDLFIICDKRGHTPLTYAHKEQYENWCSFLSKNKDIIHPTVLGTRTD
jgi:hypothetical protein